MVCVVMALGGGGSPAKSTCVFFLGGGGGEEDEKDLDCRRSTVKVRSENPMLEDKQGGADQRGPIEDGGSSEKELVRRRDPSGGRRGAGGRQVG